MADIMSFLLPVAFVFVLLIIVIALKTSRGKSSAKQTQNAEQDWSAKNVHCSQCSRRIMEEGEEYNCSACDKSFCYECFEKGGNDMCEACLEKEKTYDVYISYSDASDDEHIVEEVSKAEAEDVVKKFKDAMIAGNGVFDYNGTVYKIADIRKVYYE